MPHRSTTPRPRKSTSNKPGKPYDGFPLYSHCLGYWSKKVNGKILHFGRWARVKKGVLTALAYEEGWRQALLNYKARIYDAHVNLGVLHQSSDRLDEAEHEYLLARYLSDHHPQPLVNLGSIYLERGRNREAIEVLLEATAMIPPPASAFFNLGIALYRSDRFAEAEQSLLRAHELDPEASSVRLMLANVYLRTRNEERLIEQLDAYLQENPDGRSRDAVERMRSEILAARVDTPAAAETEASVP